MRYICIETFVHTKLLYFLSYIDICIAIIMYCQRLFRNTFIFGEFILFCMFLTLMSLEMGKKLKLKVKSEFSLSMGLMLINHSNPYIHSTTILCDMTMVHSLAELEWTLTNMI